MLLHADALYLMRHAETLGTQTRKFMSNNSSNSHICEKGKCDIALFNNNIDKYHFDCVIVCCNIPRVLETAEEFKKLYPNLKYVYDDRFRGIDNSGWEGKGLKDLTNEDLEDYKEREIKRNIFAKSVHGSSWGEVLLNSIDLINHINRYYENQRLLLISQGSIFQGIKLLTHATTVPWEDYDSKKMFNFDSRQKISYYGRIVCLYDNSKYISED